MAKTVKHPTLGVFHYLDPLPIWQSIVKWNARHSVRCEILQSELTKWDESLALAGKAIAMLREGSAEIDRAIVEALFEIYNNVWREDDDPILSSDQFLEKLRLEAVQVEPHNLSLFAGSETLITIVYEADCMFGDHDVDVYLDVDLKVRGVGLG